jgi:hypothetical protein
MSHAARWMPYGTRMAPVQFGGGSIRPFLLTCDTEQERDEWLAAVR